MSSDCIFCRIVEGKLPSAKVYEDEWTLAFMDIGPVAKGHTLVIPKQHSERLTTAPVEVLRETVVTVRKVARAVAAAMRADGLTITQANGPAAGQVVPHVHFHIIPRFGGGHTPQNWVPGRYESSAEMAELAARIAAALSAEERTP